MPAFGDDLCADDQVDLARFDGTSGLCYRVRTRYEASGHDQAAGLGEQFRRFLSKDRNRNRTLPWSGVPGAGTRKTIRDRATFSC